MLRPRRSAGLPERGRTVLGEAGLGKSSLVRRIAAEAERDGDWVTPQLRIPLGADPVKLVAGALLQLADRAGLAASRERRIGELINRVQSVSLAGHSATIRPAEGPEPFRLLADLLVDIGRAALAQNRVVLVHLDEVQNITNEAALSQVLTAFGDALASQHTVTAPGGAAIARSLPIAVYLTGLPDFADMAGARQGATFARRFQTTVLGALDDDDLASALQPFVVEGWEVSDELGGTGRIRMEPDAARAIIDLSCGEPFLFQLAGERAWYASGTEVITRAQVLAGWRGAVPEAIMHVERILERLPPRESDFLRSMARLAPEKRSLSAIARAAGFERAADAGPTSQRLDTVRGIIDRGRPYTFRHRAVEAYLTSDWPTLS